MEQIEKDLMHKWEVAGIGKAPFTVRAIISLPSRGLLEANVEAYNNGMREAVMQGKSFGVALGTCDVCGMALTVHFVIRDADGKHFVCGSECVRKTGNDKLVKKANLLNNERIRTIRREKNQVKWEENQKVWKAKQEALKAEREKAEAKRRAKESLVLADLENAHKWLTDVLDTHDWNFCIEISNQLKNHFRPLIDYPDRAVEILSDIYSKSFGRTGSKKYKQAKEEFENLVITSSEVVNSLKEKLG